MKTAATALRIQTSAAPIFCTIPLHFPTPFTRRYEITMTGNPVARAKTAGMITGSPAPMASGMSMAKKSTAENGQKESAKITPSRNAPRYPLSASRAEMPDVNPENQSPPGSRSK